VVHRRRLPDDVRARRVVGHDFIDPIHHFLTILSESSIGIVAFRGIHGFAVRVEHALVYVWMPLHGLAEEEAGVNLHQQELLSIWSYFELFSIVMVVELPLGILRLELQLGRLVREETIMVATNRMNRNILNMLSHREQVHHSIEFFLCWRTRYVWIQIVSDSDEEIKVFN